MSGELTELQRTERAAVIGAMGQTLRVVSALRRYRAAAQRLFEARSTYRQRDDVALDNFAAEVAKIEEEDQ